MTTLADGNLVEQLNGRIWRILGRGYDALGWDRWRIELVTPASRESLSEYVPGLLTSATAEWLNDNCHDFTLPVIEPPQGDGRQSMVITLDGEVVANENFDTVAAMLQWASTHLAPDLVGHWYGWEQEPDINEPACMTVTFVEGELVWAE